MDFTHANIVSILIAAVAPGCSAASTTPCSASLACCPGQTRTMQPSRPNRYSEGRAVCLGFVSEIIIAWVLYGILMHMNLFTARRHHLGRLLLVRLRPDHDCDHQRVRRPPCDATVIDSVAWLGAL